MATAVGGPLTSHSKMASVSPDKQVKAADAFTTKAYMKNTTVVHSAFTLMLSC